MCLGVFLLGSSFFGTLWASWAFWKSISIVRLGKVSFIMFSNKFSISCSSSSPSSTLMIQMLEHLKLSGRFLSLSSFYGILVSSFCFSQMFTFSFCSKLLIWVLVSFPSLLVPCIFCFISLLPLYCNLIQPFLWASWLPMFWTLHLIGWLSFHHLVLFWELWSVLTSGPYFLFWCTCYILRGRALGIHEWCNPHCCIVALYVG